MFPSQNLNLSIDQISGILGSISIACWVVVFSPQIIENFRRSSADGLSLQFIIVWLAGDVFNILGAVLQGVLPTMLILAIYYTIADIVLLLQCFYYRGFTWRDEVVPPKSSAIGEADERTGLLAPGDATERRPSSWSEAQHLSPAIPLLDTDTPRPAPKPYTYLQALLFNSVVVLMVCAAGVLGWWVSSGSHSGRKDITEQEPDFIELNLWGQVFGYFCAVLYLGSRVPQILLNYRRKSTEGISILFFLFACVGNLTYVLSIFAFDPRCGGEHGHCAKGEAAKIYGQYILANASWLAGSMGTLFLDMGIFAQFFIYRERDDDEDIEEDIAASENVRSLLQQEDTAY